MVRAGLIGPGQTAQRERSMSCCCPAVLNSLADRLSIGASGRVLTFARAGERVSCHLLNGLKPHYTIAGTQSPLMAGRCTQSCSRRERGRNQTA